MKKWIIGLLSFAILIVSSLYCFTILKPVFTISTDLSNININEVKLDQTFKTNSDYCASKNGKYITYDHHKMGTFLVTVRKSKVNVIELLSDSACCNGISSKGIKIYESFRDVKKYFGTHYYKSTSERYGDIITYIDKKNKWKLVFALSENKKVTAIILYDYKKYDYQY